jgi:hypothetical protein
VSKDTADVRNSQVTFCSVTSDALDTSHTSTFRLLTRLSSEASASSRLESWEAGKPQPFPGAGRKTRLMWVQGSRTGLGRSELIWLRDCRRTAPHFDTDPAAQNAQWHCRSELAHEVAPRTQFGPTQPLGRKRFGNTCLPGRDRKVVNGAAGLLHAEATWWQRWDRWVNSTLSLILARRACDRLGK